MQGRIQSSKRGGAEGDVIRAQSARQVGGSGGIPPGKILNFRFSERESGVIW